MGRIIFKSEEVEKKLHEIFSFCHENRIDLTIESIELSSYEIRRQEDFDLKQFLQQEHFDMEIYITDDSEIRIGLQRVFEDEEVTFGYFYEAMNTALVGEVVENKQFLSPRFFLVYVDCDLNVLEKLDEQEYSINQLWGDTEIDVSIAQGLTSFGIRLSLDGNYDKYYPPVVSEDTFIQIKTNRDLDLRIFEDIVQSYIFELQSAFSLNLQRVTRITGLEYYDDDDRTDSPKRTQKMRPLLNGKG
ncbi:hypothetical protein [Paenibacillus hexagrammi]|uniref:Uncharacterized protein n=1 Tax=Paenibacillus hexagrammi TaxID=2908839 RepID=A0ABY3SDW8_9BACL|nr:hypothetical protein [Paenibacillus sp. YPD9-1]UJF32174.1 hypothetical protein L0M14_20940 [Paenibacillus sp. YPD9-1]